MIVGFRLRCSRLRADALAVIAGGSIRSGWLGRRQEISLPLRLCRGIVGPVGEGQKILEHAPPLAVGICIAPVAFELGVNGSYVLCFLTRVRHFVDFGVKHLAIICGQNAVK